MFKGLGFPKSISGKVLKLSRQDDLAPVIGKLALGALTTLVGLWDVLYYSYNKQLARGCYDDLRRLLHYACSLHCSSFLGLPCLKAP